MYFCKVVIADDLEGKNEAQLELLVLGRNSLHFSDTEVTVTFCSKCLCCFVFQRGHKTVSMEMNKWCFPLFMVLILHDRLCCRLCRGVRGSLWKHICSRQQCLFVFHVIFFHWGCLSLTNLGTLLPQKYTELLIFTFKRSEIHCMRNLRQVSVH